jgi:hypothetical protein
VAHLRTRRHARRHEEWAVAYGRSLEVVREMLREKNTEAGVGWLRKRAEPEAVEIQDV